LSKQIKNRVSKTKSARKTIHKIFIWGVFQMLLLMNYLLVKRGLTYNEMVAYIKDSMETGIRIVKESRA